MDSQSPYNPYSTLSPNPTTHSSPPASRSASPRPPPQPKLTARTPSPRPNARTPITQTYHKSAWDRGPLLLGGDSPPPMYPAEARARSRSPIPRGGEDKLEAPEYRQREGGAAYEAGVASRVYVDLEPQGEQKGEKKGEKRDKKERGSGERGCCRCAVM
jgi:hypothetical protein